MKEVDFKSLQVENINYSDYPDFCDAYIYGGFFVDGEPLDDETIEKFVPESWMFNSQENF